MAPLSLHYILLVKKLLRGPWVPPVLAMEVEITRWPSEAVGGHPAVDQRNQPCQAALGCSEDSRRTAQAWRRCRPDDRSQIHGEEQETAVARMEDISAQSCRRDSVDRLVCCPDHLVSTAVWVTDSQTRSPRNPVSFSNGTSQRRVDQSATDGSLWMGGGALLSRARSGQRLWRGFHAATSGNGHTGSADRAAVTMAEWLL